MSNKNNDNLKKKEMEVITGDGKNLDISPVYDHLIIDKPVSSEKKKDVIIPKEKKVKKSND